MWTYAWLTVHYYMCGVSVFCDRAVVTTSVFVSQICVRAPFYNKTPN